MPHALLLLLAVQASEQDAKGALEKFKSAYGAPDPTSRAAAVSDLGQTPHELVVKKLGAVLTTDLKPVRIAAARTLGGLADKRRLAAGALLNGLPANAKEPEVQSAILLALGRLKEEIALPAIHDHFDAKAARVAGAAFQAAVAFGGTRSYDAIIAAMKPVEKVVREADRAASAGGGLVALPGDDTVPRARAILAEATKAMQALTGEKWTTAAEWELWWARKKLRTKPAKR